jgi:hypothetical protein
MHWVSAKFVSRLLTYDLLQRANDNENLLKNVITGDEMWVMVMTLKPDNNPHAARVLIRLSARKHNTCTCK